MRTSRPVTVTLGEMQDRVYERVQSGAYASVSEVVRAGLRALDREEGALDEWMRRRVEDAVANPQANAPAQDVFTRLRAHHARKLRDAGEAG